MENPQTDFQAVYLAEIFTSRLPHKPYATDDPKKGVWVNPKPRALKRRYLQVGHYPHGLFRLVLDVDRPYPEWEEASEALPPTLGILNPEKGTLHVLYELQDPFPPEGRCSPESLHLLSRVEGALEALWEADPAYGGLLARNPVHPAWPRLGGGKLWDLGLLSQELSEIFPRRKRQEALDRATTADHSRNVALFDRLRFWAYGQVGLYRGRTGGLAAFQQVVLQEAHRLNGELFSSHPKGFLPPWEVRATAKSVARWTFEHYRGQKVFVLSSTGRPDRSRLSQAARALVPSLEGKALREARREGAQKTNAIRRQETEAKLLEALKRLQARGEEVTVRSLAREAGVHPSTASRWIRRMRGEGGVNPSVELPSRRPPYNRLRGP